MIKARLLSGITALLVCSFHVHCQDKGSSGECLAIAHGYIAAREQVTSLMCEFEISAGTIPRLSTLDNLTFQATETGKGRWMYDKDRLCYTFSSSPVASLPSSAGNSLLQRNLKFLGVR